MKKLFIILGINLLLAGSIMAQKPKDYKDIVPEELQKYKFGMPLPEYLRKFDTQLEDSSIFDFRTELVVNNPKPGIESVTLYFDKENNQPLYELIISYSNLSLRDKFIAKYYGQPDADADWLWKMPDGNLAKAWKFQNSLVIAVAYPGTEWVGEWE